MVFNCNMLNEKMSIQWFKCKSIHLTSLEKRWLTILEMILWKEKRKGVVISTSIYVYNTKKKTYDEKHLNTFNYKDFSASMILFQNFWSSDFLSTGPYLSFSQSIANLQIPYSSFGFWSPTPRPRRRRS